MKYLPILIIAICVLFFIGGDCFSKLEDSKSYETFTHKAAPLFHHHHLNKDSVCIFYDGEGNVIPNGVVNLLVMSQFVHMTHSEDSVINHYFYFNKH
jgi:hypothetical protein